MWLKRSRAFFEPSPLIRAIRSARPGAISRISDGIPSFARSASSQRAVFISLPGGFEVSIRRYSWRRGNRSLVADPAGAADAGPADAGPADADGDADSGSLDGCAADDPGAPNRTARARDSTTVDACTARVAPSMGPLLYGTDWV